MYMEANMFRMRRLFPLVFVTAAVGQTAPQIPHVYKSQHHDTASVTLSQIPVSEKKFRGASQIEHRVRKLNIPPKAAVAQPDGAVQSTTDRPFGVPASASRSST